MAAVNDYDVVVVGGGPGGYTTAIRAAQLGFSTALVEREALGGVCLNWGCIPTKALLHCAELVHDIRGAERFGIDVDFRGIRLDAMVEHSRATARRLSQGVAYLLRKNGVTHLEGHGRLAAKGQLSVRGADGSEQTLRVPHIVLATGASLARLPGLPEDSERIWDARAAMVATELPERLVVIGAGAIGVEFASFYADVGARVTLVEMADRVVPGEDHEISERMQEALEKRGIDCRTGTRYSSVEDTGSGLTVHLEDAGGGDAIECDRLLVAVGVSGNSRDLGLEELGVDVERSFIVTGDYGQTSVVGVYAIGDVAGAPWLAHKAAHEGVACVERLAGLRPDRPHAALIPGCIYSRPQVASIGLSEAAARERGRELRVGRYDLMANGKALASGHGSGLVKTVVDAGTGELLGAHMIGHGVSEQIQGFALAMGAEITSDDFADTVFPHPTQSEAMHEAVLDAAGLALNQ